MADPTAASADDSAAEVSITANAAPFDEALDKAAEHVASWGERVTSRFASISDAIQSRTAKIGEAFNAISAKTQAGESAAAAIGSTVGEALGGLSIAGFSLGPLGAKVGGQLGKGIVEGLEETFNETLNLQAALDNSFKLRDALTGTFDQAKDALEGFKFSAGRRFDEIKDIVKELNLADIVKGDLATALSKIEDVANRVGDRLELLAAQGAARIADLIDAAVNNFKEPVAKAVDGLQWLLEQIGLIERGTDKWGDSVRGLENVVVESLAAIAKALGTVYDAVNLAAGVFVKGLEVPFLNAVEKMLGALKSLAHELSVVDEDFAKEIERSIGLAQQMVGRTAKQLEEAADQAIGKRVGETGDVFANWVKDKVGGFFDRGRKQNVIDDALRKAGEAAAPEPAPTLAPAIQARDRNLSALIGGSREAANQIVNVTRASMNPMAVDPQKQAVKKLDDLGKKADDTNRKLDRVGTLIEGLPDGIKDAMTADDVEIS